MAPSIFNPFVASQIGNDWFAGTQGAQQLAMQKAQMQLAQQQEQMQQLQLQQAQEQWKLAEPFYQNPLQWYAGKMGMDVNAIDPLTKQRLLYGAAGIPAPPPLNLSDVQGQALQERASQLIKAGTPAGQAYMQAEYELRTAMTPNPLQKKLQDIGGWSGVDNTIKSIAEGADQPTDPDLRNLIEGRMSQAQGGTGIYSGLTGIQLPGDMGFSFGGSAAAPGAAPSASVPPAAMGMAPPPTPPAAAPPAAGAPVQPVQPTAPTAQAPAAQPPAARQQPAQDRRLGKEVNSQLQDARKEADAAMTKASDAEAQRQGKGLLPNIPFFGFEDPTRGRMKASVDQLFQIAEAARQKYISLLTTYGQNQTLQNLPPEYKQPYAPARGQSQTSEQQQQAKTESTAKTAVGDAPKVTPGDIQSLRKIKPSAGSTPSTSSSPPAAPTAPAAQPAAQPAQTAQPETTPGFSNQPETSQSFSMPWMSPAAPMRFMNMPQPPQPTTVPPLNAPLQGREMPAPTAPNIPYTPPFMMRPPSGVPSPPSPGRIPRPSTPGTRQAALPPFIPSRARGPVPGPGMRQPAQPSAEAAGPAQGPGAEDRPTSTLSSIVSMLESGRGQYSAKQPKSMVDPMYGQYKAFQQQYGRGAVGVDNYARQILRANPNATLGQFYSSYVLGTGNPARTYFPEDLRDMYQSAFRNLSNYAKRAGLTLNTPLATLMGPVYQD
jgi:hypothetical protein